MKQNCHKTERLVNFEHFLLSKRTILYIALKKAYTQLWISTFAQTLVFVYCSSCINFKRPFCFVVLREESQQFYTLIFVHINTHFVYTLGLGSEVCVKEDGFQFLHLASCTYPSSLGTFCCINIRIIPTLGYYLLLNILKGLQFNLFKLNFIPVYWFYDTKGMLLFQ